MITVVVMGFFKSCCDMNGMMSSKLMWLMVIQLLLNEQVLCRAPLPLRNTLLPGSDIHAEVDETTEQGHQFLLGSKRSSPPSVLAQKKVQVWSAKHIASYLREKLKGQVQDHLHIQGDVTCEELLSTSILDDPSSSVFPREVLGVSLVPVLVMAGCPQEAQTLVLKLYNLLGIPDTDKLLMELGDLIEKKMRHSTSLSASATSTSENDKAEHHIEAVMFNIQQLAMVGESATVQEGRCDWLRVNGTILIGRAVDEATDDLDEAERTCKRLGVLCAGVTSSDLLKPGKYQAVLKKDSRILPSQSAVSECWIHQCITEADDSNAASAGQRLKRSPRSGCINKSEVRVYNVMEWIPAVSTLYNLGTAVYYASVNCSQTAKERAILSAVDLGTDALMVATGGTVGVAGYALGAGVKTGVKAGVKYLLNSMRQEDDVLVNQFSWENVVSTAD